MSIRALILVFLWMLLSTRAASVSTMPIAQPILLVAPIYSDCGIAYNFYYFCKETLPHTGLKRFFHFKTVDMSQVSYFTKEGLEKLRQEVSDLKGRGRSEMAKAIQEARDKGDLSENAEYDAAKDAQGLLELKISKLEFILGNARVLDESQIDLSKVQPLTTVKIKNTANGAVMAYTLVSEKEADLKSGRISVSSPIGAGLLGKKVGELAEITIPSGIVRFEIVEIGI